jgi:hypothetical protein
MHGSVNWAISRSDKRKIKSAKMRFLIAIAGHAFKDRVKNGHIVETLRTFNLTRRIGRRKNWSEHL